MIDIERLNNLDKQINLFLESNIDYANTGKAILTLKKKAKKLIEFIDSMGNGIVLLIERAEYFNLTVLKNSDGDIVIFRTGTEFWKNKHLSLKIKNTKEAIAETWGNMCVVDQALKEMTAESK